MGKYMSERGEFFSGDFLKTDFADDDSNVVASLDRETIQRQERLASQEANHKATEAAAQDAMEQFQTAYQEARQANEERYQKLLGMSDELTNQRASDIRTKYQQEIAQTQQKLGNLGMRNTTIAPTLRTGYQREQQSALNEATNIGKRRKMDIIRSRQDTYPARGRFLQTLRRYGEGMGVGGVG